MEENTRGTRKANRGSTWEGQDENGGRERDADESASSMAPVQLQPAGVQQFAPTPPTPPAPRKADRRHADGSIARTRALAFCLSFALLHAWRERTPSEYLVVAEIVLLESVERVLDIFLDELPLLLGQAHGCRAKAEFTEDALEERTREKRGEGEREKGVNTMQRRVGG